MIGLRLAWRFLRRDLRGGEVSILLAALALAVMAVTAVGFVTTRAEKALALEANRLLGGDVVLRADSAIGQAPRQLARELGLTQTETWSFPSMLRAGDGLKLAEVRALGEGFPLRGHYRIRDAQGERDSDAIPAPGTAWLSRSGAELLGVTIGDAVTLGRSSFRIGALVLQEPDAAMDYFNVAPRVFMRLDEVAATALVQEGSRVGYRLILAAPDARAQRFVDLMQGRLERGQRLETVADARPEVRRALDQGDRFLGLAALVAVILAAIAVAMASSLCRSPAGAEQIVAWNREVGLAISAAPAAVEPPSWTVACGRLVATQSRHCAAAWGWVTIRRTSARVVPGLAYKLNSTGSSTSRVIISGRP